MKLLKDAIKQCIKLASEMLCESISFPALGAGCIFGFPIQVVCLAIYSAVEEYVMNTVDSS